MNKPLNDAQIRALPVIPTGGRKTVNTCGFGLSLVNEPVKGAKACKRFVFKYVQKLPNGSTKQQELRLGVYGSGGGQISLAKARQEMNLFKDWRKNIGLHAHHKDWQSFKKPVEPLSVVTLKDVADEWMDSAIRQEKALSTQKECRQHLENHVYRDISPDLPIKDLEWRSGDGTGGRRYVQKVRDVIEGRKSHDMANRVIRTLSQVCDYAIEKGVMCRDENPCTISPGDRAKHKSVNNPTLEYKEVPSFFKKLTSYNKGQFDLVVTAIKLYLLLCTRPGALVAIEWSWIDEANALITIPGTTEGLKRILMHRDQDHLIPISNSAQEIIDQLKKYNGNRTHLFFSSRGDKYPHLTPSALNNFLKEQLDMRGLLTAQGWRSVIQTVGQDILGFPWEIMDRQLGHLPHKAGVRGFYDNSELLDERRKFMNAWSNWCIKEGLIIP